MWTRVELKNQCKEVMSRSYGKMFVVALLASIAYGVLQIDLDEITYNPNIRLLIGACFLALQILAVSVIEVGASKFFILNANDENVPVSTVFSMFKSDQYWNVVKIMFLKNLKTILWMLLLVVPGIIKSYEYSMIPYLLAENPGMSSSEAFATSKKMTTNQKMDMFVLHLSFGGWYILGTLACGFGLIFVAPYVYGTEVQLYFKLKTDSMYFTF